MAPRLKNIPLRVFRDYLKWKGLKIIRTKGGHEIWGGVAVTRPIVLQSHVDPIPEFIVRSVLRTLGANSSDFDNFLKATC